MAPPQTQYARTPGGLIAYQVTGAGPVDLVYLTGATSHVDVRWDHPTSAHFLERLASFSRMILFDRRGAGASDRLPGDVVPTSQEWADDLVVVLDAVGSKQAVIVAVLDAGPMAIVFAATYPERTKALVLINTTACYFGADESPHGALPEAGEAVAAAFEAGWGTEDFAMLVSPSLARDAGLRSWFAKYMRAGGTPRAVAEQYRAILAADVRWVLPSVHVPTLVMNRRELVFANPDHGRYIAHHVPDGRFVELPGGDSMVITDGADELLDTVEEFVTGVRPHHEADRVLATLLYTDVVESTRRAVELGDHRWRAVLDQHDDLSRDAIERHRGRLIKTTGDGLIATFDAPGRAIRCALAIRHAVTDLGLVLRIGLHSGEVELRGDDLGGIAMHIGQRVAMHAPPGEVVVSSTVKDLMVGSDVDFEDRGEHELKGVPGMWRLFAVRN